jgi:hypothetical protein
MMKVAETGAFGLRLSGGSLTPSCALWELRKSNTVEKRTCFLPTCCKLAIAWEVGHIRTKPVKLIMSLLYRPTFKTVVIGCPKGIL